MGRWSHAVALEFLKWLQPEVDRDWLDIGCGTGALSRAILETCSPRSLIGIEPSEGFVGHARQTISDGRARFEVADAEHLPLDAVSVDVIASALVLNFVPDQPAAIGEMRRVTRPGGTISFYVWDYPGGGIGFIDEFWKAAVEEDGKAAALDEARRFPACTPDGLADLCRAGGLSDPVVDAIEIETVFASFADFMHPFTLGTGPAPGYYVSLEGNRQERLRDILARNLGSAEPIGLKARVWAVRCNNP
jgi:SAM-dependent methyltransferase